MSYGWYWKCNDCIPVKDFLEKLWRDEQLIKREILKDAYPYYDLELMSNRRNEKRRCSKCKRWHSQNDKNWNPKECPKHIPFDIPTCGKCGKEKKLLFIEKSKAIVFVKSSFTIPEPDWGPTSVYDPYFYSADRHEEEDYDGDRVISTVYFSGKNGKNYGTFSPYFSSRFPFEELREWLEREIK